MIAIPAGDKAAQREIDMDIGTGRRESLSSHPFLYLMEGSQRYDRLVMAGTKRHVPHIAADIPGIDRVVHDPVRLLVRQMSVASYPETRMRFQEPFHLRLGFEAPGGKSRQAFLNDRRHRLVTDKDAAPGWAFLIPITQRRVKDPIAAQHPRPHAVADLFGILLALMLGNARQKMLNEDAVGVRAELDGRRFQRSARTEDRLFQIEVIADITRHAANVVNDDDQPSLAGFADESQHVIEARTLGQLARHVIGENANDLMAPMLRILAATGLLRGEAVALSRLFLGTDAAVDDCLLIGFSGHGANCLLRPLVLIAPSLRRSTSSETSDSGRLA
ncbi:hypothetical protein ABC347_00925 [Sphingomonas sp. 1P06PA]